MNVVQTLAFKKAVKKLKKNQKDMLDDAIKMIMGDVNIGHAKKGDLAGVRVYKFKMVKQEMLLAYHFEGNTLVLTLLGLGSHENFYRDLKR